MRVPVYDPEAHDGLLMVGGRDVIVADAKAAKLTELPQQTQEALIIGTVDEMIEAILLKEIEVPGLMHVNHDLVDTRLRGMKKGLELLGQDANALINKQINEIRRLKGMGPTEPRDWV